MSATEKKKEAPKQARKEPRVKVVPRLRTQYLEEIRPKLMQDLNLKNVNQVPRLDKIIVSMGVGEAIKDNAFLVDAAGELGMITGQKPILIKARKSVSNFHLRKGMQIACKVTLRAERMYEFLERFICVALPRIRDFRGVPAKSFDGRGNYSMGIDDQLIFPEIDADKVKRPQGMNIAIVTTAGSDDSARALLKEFGMPFAK